MGICIAKYDANFDLKRGDILRYSLSMTEKERSQWVLTNQDILRTMKITKSEALQNPPVDCGERMARFQFYMKAEYPGQETLLFAKYNAGKRSPKAIDRKSVV